MSTVIAIEKNHLGYQVFFVTPGVAFSGDSLWMCENSLREVFEVCEKRGALIAYIINGKKIEAPSSSKYCWHPELTREKVMAIFNTQQNYVEWLCQSQNPTVPKTLDQLEECLICFGGIIMMRESIYRKLNSNQDQELTYQNGRGFKIQFSPELAKEFVDKYHF